MKRIVFLILLALPMWALTQATPPPPHGSSLLPPGDGKPIVQRACVGCHSLDVVTSEPGSAAHWTQVVNQMIGRGAELSDPEIDTLVKYLSSHFGPVSPTASSGESIPSTPGAATGRVNVNTASAQELQSSLGLSQKVAEAVVQYRTKNGKFKTWQDVAEVPEASPNQIEALQDRLAY
jgi:competence ComEA-like helix-hairpin-helix protein